VAKDIREVDPNVGGQTMSPHAFIPILIVTLTVVAGLALYALLDLPAGGGRLPPTSSATADDESTDTPTPAVPESENNYRWARRIEADERIAEAALRKEEAEAMSALEEDE